MYNQPYFIPSYYATMAPSMMRGGAAMAGPMMRGAGGALGRAATAGRGLGLFSRLGNSLGAVRTLNWGGLINGASKTLGVINQTIPLVKQVGPMFQNVRSMLKVASVFKDETDQVATNGGNKMNQQAERLTNKGSYQVNERKQNKQIVETNQEIEKQQLSTDRSENNPSPTFFIA